MYVHFDLNVLFMWKLNFEKKKNGTFYEYDNAATPYYQFLLYDYTLVKWSLSWDLKQEQFDTLSSKSGHGCLREVFTYRTLQI